ncbi:lipocalin family protein [Vibrio sp. TH_r3]|uniref:lipocalin family protein n=1 Tax=Vibrio sp. TH_r3 TaxID=3082084 RepID=UPI0029556209|nr:lipocalin family protein [Vibrio sp. TH_r3]MDV7104981.1 lipocalin family protein [Vibrio sp. TH_r3]
MKYSLLSVLVLLLGGCLGMPAKVEPVMDFEVEKYMGEWHEIARLDHSFERGLTQVSAEYTLQENGRVDVVNRGYLASNDEWKEAEGKAYFVDAQNEGYLKVSFFGPFYGSYVVFELESNYQYAFVSGPDTDYLWLLSRTKTVSDEVLAKFKRMATEHEFDISKLIYVEQ